MRLLPALLMLPAAALAAQGPGLSGPVDITANQLDIKHNEGQAVFAGNVRVVQGALTLTAPRVTVTYGKQGRGDITQMRAENGATFTRAGPVTEIAKGTTAVYNPSRQELTLTGVVSLTRGASTLEGDRLLYDIAAGNAQVTNSKGPVKARFTPGAQ